MAENFTRIISNTKKTPKAAPKAKLRNNGWKQNSCPLAKNSDDGGDGGGGGGGVGGGGVCVCVLTWKMTAGTNIKTATRW